MANLTDKQLLLLKIVADGSGNPSDWWLDLDQILGNLKMLGWETTKQSLQFVVRSLIRKGFIEKRSVRRRRSYHRRLLATTDVGRTALNNALGRIPAAIASVRS
jgi:hypothetical protein